MLDVSRYTDVIFSCSVKAGMTGYWSEAASLTTLENLLQNGHITLEQYLERLPEGYINAKEGLIEDCRRNMALLEKEGLNEGQTSV